MGRRIYAPSDWPGRRPTLATLFPEGIPAWEPVTDLDQTGRPEVWAGIVFCTLEGWVLAARTTASTLTGVGPPDMTDKAIGDTVEDFQFGVTGSPWLIIGSVEARPEVPEVPPQEDPAVTIAEIQPGGEGTNAIFSLVIDIESGTFNLRYDVDGEYVMTGIPSDVSAAQLMASIDQGEYADEGPEYEGTYNTVTGSGTSLDPFIVEFIGPYAESPAVFEEVFGEGSPAIPAIPAFSMQPIEWAVGQDHGHDVLLWPSPPDGTLWMQDPADSSPAVTSTDQPVWGEVLGPDNVNYVDNPGGGPRWLMLVGRPLWTGVIP